MTALLGWDREPDSALPLDAQLRFDAGSAALNLLATRGSRGSDHPIERIPTPRRLRDWLAGTGLPDVPVDAAALAAAHEVREAGYGVLAALVTGRAPDRADVATLGRWAARPLPGAGLRAAGGAVRWDAPAPTFDTVLVGLARELAAHAVDGARGLHLCEADRCRLLYLDRSRGHRRRWCSMGRCGNRAKVRRHRARAERPGAGQVQP